MNKQELELINGFFNEGWCCNLDEVYDAVMNLQKENEKLNHYKLLYQKVKEKNDKAIEYINIVAMATNKPQYFQKLKETIWGEEILDILKGNNEEVSDETN